MNKAASLKRQKNPRERGCKMKLSKPDFMPRSKAMERAILDNLNPEHLGDLRKSRLSNETIEAAGIKTVPPDEITEKLGFTISNIESMYEIPYPGTDFRRYKVFYSDDSYKERPKYLQCKGSGNRLYIPHKVRAILKDTSIPLYVTEGEKKALKACQEGLFCVGLSGLWNWSDGNKELIADFDQITLKDRTVYIVPDSDWQEPNKHGYKKNLEQAVYGLANKLKERGARIFIKQLPQKEG
jgi:putative DNA primase/helicase